MAHRNQLAQSKVRPNVHIRVQTLNHSLLTVINIVSRLMPCCLSHLGMWSFLLQAPEGVSESLTLAQLQGELVGVQSSLFSLGLELEASQRSLRQSQRQGDDLIRFKDRLNSDLQEALQHREVTEKHNQVSMFVKV